jgi:hypothetical protein
MPLVMCVTNVFDSTSELHYTDIIWYDRKNVFEIKCNRETYLLNEIEKYGISDISLAP